MSSFSKGRLLYNKEFVLSLSHVPGRQFQNPQNFLSDRTIFAFHGKPLGPHPHLYK